jgi:predicted lipoprotein with Yx(FWY)xxD motif
MKRIIITIAALLATAVTAVAAQAAAAPTVKLASTGKGKLLKSSSGQTLYMFTKDSKNKDTCAGIKGCSGTWPMFTTKGKPVGGPGVSTSKLGTIKVGSKTQVTYAGHPLYIYSLDPKGTSYIGTPEFGGKWYGVTASGSAVK